MAITKALKTYAPQALVLVGCLALIMAWQMGLMSSPHPLVGKPAPSLRLNALDGKTFNLSEHRGKDIVVLDFFATWCPPCREGLPVIARLAKEYEAKGAVIYAVNLHESPETVRTFLEQEDLDLPILMDDRQEGAMAFEVNSIPQTVVIDKEGTIQAVHVGVALRMEQILRGEIEALLAGKTLLEPKPGS